MTRYVVTLTMSGALSEERADALVDELRRHGPAVSLNPDSAKLTLTLEAADFGDAAVTGLSLLPGTELAALHVETEEARDLREFGSSYEKMRASRAPKETSATGLMLVARAETEAFHVPAHP